MSNFNIFSTGNGITFGQNTMTEHTNTHDDSFWNKRIPCHPDNLYRSYADILASRMDARIFYIGNNKMTTIKIANIFEDNFNLVKRNYPNNINLHLINLSHGSIKDYNLMLDNKLMAKINRLQTKPTLFASIKKEIYYEFLEVCKNINTELQLVTELFKKVNKIANYNNRVVLIMPDFADLKYSKNGDFIFDKRTYTEELITNKWASIIQKDMKTILDMEESESINNKITYEDHQKLGEFIYNRLTKDTKLLTI